MVERLEITHFHLFAGLGGAALGFTRGAARYGELEARFRCLGGVDSDPAACRDFGRLVGVPATQLDLFDRQQYRDFHGKEPPADWREITPDDLRAAAGCESPDVLVTSPPCKGLSALLPEGRAASPKYQALNRLTLRGIMLALEAWADDLPAFFLLENVPGIARRGRRFLDGIVALLEGAGYSVAETVHVYRLVDWSEPSPAVTGGGGPSSGGLAVADPRTLDPTRHADPNQACCIPEDKLPEPSERCVPLIVALDGTWHRPLTTLELAALQGLVDLDQAEPTLELDGTSDSKHRERIGNAIPVGAAAAVASVIGHAMLLAHAGETFVLASTPVWARDIARLIALDSTFTEES